MTFKTIIGILIVFATTILGFKFGEKKRFKKVVYNDLVNLCITLKSDLGYLNITVDKIISKMPNSLKEIVKLSPQNFIEGQKIKILDKRFSADEQEEIALFFDKLGVLDSKNLIKFIEHYEVKFKNRLSSAESVYKKNSTFCVKIGALLGALIFVIVI